MFSSSSVDKVCLSPEKYVSSLKALTSLLFKKSEVNLNSIFNICSQNSFNQLKCLIVLHIFWTMYWSILTFLGSQLARLKAEEGAQEKAFEEAARAEESHRKTKLSTGKVEGRDYWTRERFVD